MARSKSGFYSTIEYIGPRPQPPKKRNFFGGWVIIVIAVGMGTWFGRPLVPFLRASQLNGSTEQAGLVVSKLKSFDSVGNRIAAAALEQSATSVAFDSSYYKISYPNGDIPANKGVAADVVVRSMRAVGIDLQVLVHEDMAENFRLYPQLWGATAPDTNIDHRRVANLERFFEHKGRLVFERTSQTPSASKNSGDYLPGDIVIWELGNAEKHIGVVVPGPTGQESDAWVVHNMGSSVKWEDVLFDYPVIKQIRFPLK